MALDKAEEEEEAIRLATTIMDRIHRIFHLKAISLHSEEINKFLQAQASILIQIVNSNKLIVVRGISGRQLMRDEQKKIIYKKKTSHRKITKEETIIIVTEILTRITKAVLETIIIIVTTMVITLIPSRILTLATMVWAV